MSDLYEWYAAQYKRAVGLEGIDAGAALTALVAAFPVAAHGSAEVPLSGRTRVMGKFLKLKTTYPLGSDGYHCLAMAATDGDFHTNYGYAYWRRGHPIEGWPEYVCISYTLDSRDGEYRNHLVSGQAFAALCESLVEKMAPVEDAITRLVAESALVLESTVYPRTGAEVDRIVDLAMSLRLPHLVLALTTTRSHARMLHASRGYAALIALLESNLREEVNMGKQDHERIVKSTEDAINTALQCGQKLVPMRLREVMQPFDFNLSVWRELMITRLVSDLVLNFISPGFALYNQWTYIEGGDEALFENAAMHDRYRRGGVVEVASDSLRAARRTLDSVEAKTFMVEELDALVYESLEYAQSHLLMSPIVFAHTIEDVGTTMASAAHQYKKTSVGYLTHANMFSDVEFATRCIFELAYSAHCLHTKLGIAHTDLHGNNITLFPWGDIRRVRDYDDPAVAFVVGPRGEADTYIFPASGTSACIIDYSRACVGPAFRPHLEEGRSPQYATNFYRDQVNRVMRALHRAAPAFVEKNQDVIKAAVLGQYDIVFPVLCAVDFVEIGANIAAVFESAAAPVEGEKRPLIIKEGAAALARRLETEGRELLVTGLHRIVQGGALTPAEYPGNVLLERVFGEWRFPRIAARDPRRLRTIQLVDAYNYNNPLAYSESDYAKYPPWARFDEIERHLGGYKMTDLFVRGLEPFFDALRPGARVEVIAEQARAEQERRDGAAVATASSWIE
jgi:hypothetical protein